MYRREGGRTWRAQRPRGGRAVQHVARDQQRDHLEPHAGVPVPRDQRGPPQGGAVRSRAALRRGEQVLRTIALEGQELSGHSHGARKEINPQGTAAGRAFEHRQPRISRNLATEPRLPGDEILFSGGVRSYLIVPLIARNQAIGAVLLASFEPDRYALEDVPFLEGVARQIALAVENMRAYEEIARLRARLEEESRYLQGEGARAGAGASGRHNGRTSAGRSTGRRLAKGARNPRSWDRHDMLGVARSVHPAPAFC